jgi:hypothetical protein
MNKNNGTTSDLAISSKTIYDCGMVAETLRKSGVMCNVSSQTSVICNDTWCWTEKGCNIKITGLAHEEIEKKVWIPLKNKFELTCAHLDVHGYYIGCIKNFIRPSDCPQSSEKSD